MYIMKTVILTVVAIALLRSAGALLPHRNHQDFHNQLAHQPVEYANLVKDLAADSEYVEVAEAEPMSPNADPQSLYQDTDSPLDTILQEPSTLPAASSPSNKWAIHYHPYTPSSTCKPASLISSDLSRIRALGFTTILLPTTDCSSLTRIASVAPAHNLTVILTIAIDATHPDGPSAQLSETIAWASTHGWDGVDLIVTGSEAIFNDEVTAPALASIITTTRTRLRAAKYTGPVTTTEPIAILAAHARTLCPTLDAIASNIHPFFNPGVSAADAGAYVRDSLAALEGICPGLAAVNLETGWPWRGRANGEAVPGRAEQREAIRGIMSREGGRSVVLGWGDDAWREEGEFGVEGSWGFGDVFEEEEED